MRDLSPNFGVLIAFVLPGLVALWGIGYHAPDFVQGWFKSTDSTAFLFAVLVSLAMGVFISGVRWLLFDKGLNRLIGPARPDLDYQRLTKTDQALKAYAFTIEHTYRHYQFNANMAVALLFAYGAWLTAELPQGMLLTCKEEVAGSLLLFSIVACLVFSARDCLQGYYKDLEQLNRDG